MKKSFKDYGEIKYVTAEDWGKLSYNPYRFQIGYVKSDDGKVCEIFSCGNAAKRMGIPQYISVEP